MIHRLLLSATVALLPILPGDSPQPAASAEHRRPSEGVTFSQAPSAGHRLIIRPAPKAPWQASLQDVEKVLYSAAGELWVFFPDRSLKPILVEPKGGPVTLYKRGPNGEFRVRLATGKTYWSQYAFQFAHEFCHVLCNYREGGRGNKWFEEALCEVASLFALGRMAETWKTDPPYPNWKSYAPALRKYADQRIKEARLPADTTLAQWYERHAEQLRKSPHPSDESRIVAGELLPLFEKHPQHWEAIGYLNSARPSESRSFSAYLEDWHKSSPEKHKPFIRQIAERFGIVLSAPPAP
jgi:hypothetical protein